MENTRPVKIAGWIGLANVPLALGVFLLTGAFPRFFPYASDSNAEMAAWFTANQAGSIALVYLPNITFVLLLWFFWGLLRILNISPSSLLGWLALGGLLLQVALFLVGNGLWLVMAHTLHQDPAHWDLLRFGFDAVAAIFFSAGFCIALTAAAIGTVFTRTAARSRSDLIAAWGSYTVAAVNLAWPFFPLITSGPLTPGTILSMGPYIAYFVWVTALSVLILRRCKTTQPPLAG